MDFEEEIFGCWCGEEFDDLMDYEVHLEEHMNNGEEEPE